MSPEAAEMFAEFIDAYNEELASFGCAARVAMPSESWHDGSIEILDADGRHLGYVPRSVKPIETAAFMDILRKEDLRRGK